jgi:hypothetical protein
MAKLGISTGIVPDDGNGDSLLDGAIKINSNFDDIYTYFGDGTNLTFTGGGVSSQWVTTGVGIHTLSNVGIGTTNPTEELTVFGDARVTGILTVGSSSITLNGITDIINVGSGVTIDGSTGIIEASSIIIDGNTFTGAAVTSITAGSGISVDQSTGNVTISATGGGGGGESYWAETTAGIHTLSNVGIGTTNPTSKFTVKGNTSLETLSVSGVSTFAGITTVTGTTLFAKQLSVSGVVTASNLEITASQGYVSFGGDDKHRATGIYRGSGDIDIQTNLPSGNFGNITIWNNNFISNSGVYLKGESVYLQDRGGNTKLQTIGAGVTVTGTTFTNQLSVSGIASVGSAITMYASTGIISATTFYGNVVGNITGSITDATNLTGGTANASSLNVSGIATISQGRIQADASSNLRFGNVAAGSGSVRNIAIGDQVLVSLSGGGGRNIGIGELSYYDTTTGQYNIGVGERAGQKVSTGSYNVILGAYDGNSGGLDIRTSSRNIVIADGEGNIRQYINSSGNVGIKTTVVTEALTVSGIVSATSFYGTLNAGQLTGTLPAIDGSALIGVVGSGSGVIIEEDGTPVGTAGTINFGSNLDVSFAGGTATVSGVSSVSTATTAFNLAGTPNLNVGVVTATSFVGNLTGTASFATVAGIATYTSEWILGAVGSSDYTFTGPGFTGAESDPVLYLVRGQQYKFTNTMGAHPFRIQSTVNGSTGTQYDDGIVNNNVSNGTLTWNVQFDAPNILYYQCTAHGSMGGKIYIIDAGVGPDISINTTGIITASSFSGSGSGLTNLPSGQLTGALPAIDGSALLNVTASGTGVVIEDDQVNVGSATTVNFGTGLDVTFSAGIATITASGGSLQSRTTVSGVTTSIANLGIGNTNITGFKSYALMRVGLSTAGWLRLYTDSESRDADVSRSIGEDPAVGSGVIAEVVTTGISTTQIISPFVMGGNLDNPADTTIYASIKNLSGSTQSITANLTILQLES